MPTAARPRSAVLPTFIPSAKKELVLDKVFFETDKRHA
jgi:hypothetical protein